MPVTPPRCQICGAAHWFAEPHQWSGAAPKSPKQWGPRQSQAEAAPAPSPPDPELERLRERVRELEAELAVTKAAFVTERASDLPASGLAETPAERAKRLNRERVARARARKTPPKRG
jgi:hypothetical protein